MTVSEIAKKANSAALLLAHLSTDIKNQVLEEMAKALEASCDEILSANEKDLQYANAEGIAKPLIARLTLNENKKAFIIIRFFRKAYYIFNKIKYIKLVDDVSHFRDKPTIATSRTMALYYFIYYEKKYIKPFLDLANKYNEGTPNFIDNIIENPSKYDLFKFQNSIPLHLILNIGW